MTRIKQLFNNFRQRWRPMVMSPSGCAFALMGMGIVLRARLFLLNASFWMDEAWVAVVITSQSLKEILAGSTAVMSGFSTAPVGFLMIEKILTLALGESEYALRLFPLACAIAAIIVFYRLVKRILPRPTALLALAFFCLSPVLIFYAAQLKQYSIDLLIALLFYQCFVTLSEREIHFKKQIAWALVAGALIWVSNASLFVLIGGTGALFIQYLQKKQWARCAHFLVPSLIWLVSFFFLHQRLSDVLKDASLFATWPGGFAEPPLFQFSNLVWAATAFYETLKDPLALSLAWVAAIFLGVGIVLAWRKDVIKALIFLLPILFTFVAACMQKYPFKGRVLIFLIPCFLFFFCQGIAFFSRKTGRWSAGVMVVAFVVFFLNPLKHVLGFGVYDFPSQDLRGMMQFVAQNYQDRDFVFMDSSGQFGFWYYGQRSGLNARLLKISSFEDRRSVPLTVSWVGKFHVGYQSLAQVDFLIYRYEFNMYDERGYFRGSRLPDISREESLRLIFEHVPFDEPVAGNRLWVLFADTDAKRMTQIATSALDLSLLRLETFKGHKATALLYDLRTRK